VYIHPIETENNNYNYNYRRQYPLYKTCRIRGENLRKIRARGAYGKSVDDIITEILKKLEYFERLGYELLSSEEGAF
jgi:hypothetical protein